jgi:two-component system sensor histidine kinase HydH
MNRNVNEILDFVRVAPLLKKETSIKKILDESLSEFVSDINISFRLPDYDVIVSCDDEKIQAVFSNIISNAISVKSKNIIISVSDDSSFVNIEFSDDGPGIPKQNLEKIFEPLFTTRPSGTGLGLCICKNIIEQHNGTITVKNDPTRFTITLPK